jgi:hypothetical protein
VTDQMTEPREEAADLEITEEDEERMRELDERIREHGIHPEGPDTATRGGFGTAATMIGEARKHLGYRETGTNDTKFNRWLGRIPGSPHEGFGYAWCHAFVSYCLWHSDNADCGPRTAGCLAGVDWFKSKGRFSQTPHVGDLVYYGPNGGTHVELVIGVSPTGIQTIGGNTSGSVNGKAFPNGDGVYEKPVKFQPRIFGYGHPLYSSGAAPPGAPVAPGAPGTKVKPMTSIRSIKQQQEAVNALGHTPKLDVDGEWGPKTEAGVKWLQKKIGAGVDGEWGPTTERLFKAKAK